MAGVVVDNDVVVSGWSAGAEEVVVVVGETGLDDEFVEDPGLHRTRPEPQYAKRFLP